MSRFLLNLREAAEQMGTSTEPLGTSHVPQSTSLYFRAPGLGNMGESLDHGFIGTYGEDLVWTDEEGRATSDQDEVGVVELTESGPSPSMSTANVTFGSASPSQVRACYFYAGMQR